ncbi:hypothetical protein [Nocardioides daejeonensis]|uniref:hypothetical protein n=1 Tax=Nocardioides daejeonensis TaxID=1046556 RepID=UPI000D74724E|nr:hypothetical protein [Nocardioides daejeonensis]
MKRRRQFSGLAASLALSAAFVLVGCGTDGDDDQADASQGRATTEQPTTDGTRADGVDAAIDAVGTEGVLDIAGEQMVGKFGITGYEVADGGLIVESDDASQFELQCTTARMILDGVGVEATVPLSVRNPSGTTVCEDAR